MCMRSLVQFPALDKPGMEAHVSNPSTQERDPRGSVSSSTTSKNKQINKQPSVVVPLQECSQSWGGRNKPITPCGLLTRGLTYLLNSNYCEICLKKQGRGLKNDT